MKVANIGRWGSRRLLGDGKVNEYEKEQDFALIDLASALGCPNFTCGCNEVDGLPFSVNAQLAVEYFRTLMDYATPKGVRILIYNCGWGNIIFDKRGWDIALPQLPGVGIKYDISHCVNRDGDYLWEMYEYGKYIGHFHVKGTLRIRGHNIPDPPAGLDDIQWGASIAILYTHDYKGALSLEPHSRVWSEGAKGDWGIRFTRDFIKKYVMDEGHAGDGRAFMPGVDAGHPRF